MTDPAKALMDATMALLPEQRAEAATSVAHTPDPGKRSDIPEDDGVGSDSAPEQSSVHQLATITQAELRTLVDLLRDCAVYLSERADTRDGADGVPLPNDAMSLLARCDNVLDAHDYDANEGEVFAVKEARDEDQRLDGRRGR